ncbi:BPTI/Kunitz domain-containing protein isoform X2 [Conger conger]|nr:BPTI/Kunitz domain-containing protein isoform X2 [Conger conger]
MCLGNCSSKATKAYPPDEREACHLPKDYGHCMSRYLRWYYNPYKGKCKGFHYTGCGGNGNRFSSEQLCNTSCTGIIDVGDMDEEDDTDTPAGLIIGIVLGLLGAIIMIVTIVMVVTNKKTDTKETKKVKKEDSPLQAEGIEMA